MKAINRLVSFILVAFILIPGKVTAQHWTDAEQEILDFTNTCFETFVQEDVDEWLLECTHDDYTRWPSGSLTPLDARSEQRMLSDWFSRNDMTSWDIQPQRIKISADAAVIHYQIAIFRISNVGSEEFFIGGRSDFLVRENGAWKIFSVHEHSVTN